MAKGVRRTIEQQIADAEAALAALKEKAKARAALDTDHKQVKAIIADINKLSADAGVSAREILKLVTGVVVPRKTRGEKSE